MTTPLKLSIIAIVIFVINLLFHSTLLTICWLILAIVGLVMGINGMKKKENNAKVAVIICAILIVLEIVTICYNSIAISKTQKRTNELINEMQNTLDSLDIRTDY